MYNKLSKKPIKWLIFVMFQGKGANTKYKALAGVL